MMMMIKNAATSSRAKMWIFRALVLVVLIKLAIFRGSSSEDDKVADATAANQKNVTEEKPPPPPVEANLPPVMIQNNQPIHPPNTYMPVQHGAEAKDLNIISPSADQITMRLIDGKLNYAKRSDLWHMGIINTKPDVLIASEGHYNAISTHYNREHRIYTLMKWILRVYRRDPNRSTPLMMIDAGSNHGLFSMVASTSGAHVIAFEPQMNLRSVIGLNARLNQVADRVRVLPFAVLNKYRKLSMSKYEKGDGGIGQLDFAAKDAIMNTQTVRLDDIPSFELLFSEEHNQKSLLNTPQEIDPRYAASLEACNAGQQEVIDEALTLRQPIHFLKIDVEGFELRALESAVKLFDAGLVEHVIMEFGPPHRWDSTVETQNVTTSQMRMVNSLHAKYLMHRAVKQWNMDIYLLPASGWAPTVNFMLKHGVDFSNGMPAKNKVVHQLKYWDFDGMPMEGDEFEMEMKGKKQLVTEVIPLREDLIDAYMNELQDIGEMYVWFAKRDGHPAVLKNLEI